MNFKRRFRHFYLLTQFGKDFAYRVKPNGARVKQTVLTRLQLPELGRGQIHLARKHNHVQVLGKAQSTQTFSLHRI
ncbi:MAG: hypothetical protein EBR17_04760 [Betaproteobacteria bacterium]|nr:hypothetical protein [Betaproteobacteria bacterium]